MSKTGILDVTIICRFVGKVVSFSFLDTLSRVVVRDVVILVVFAVVLAVAALE